MGLWEHRQLEANEQLLAYDILALYLSLQCFGDEQSVFPVVAAEIKSHYPGPFGNLVVSMLKLLLQMQLVTCNGECYSQKQGLTTGLSCSSTIAKIYLGSQKGYDSYVCTELQPRSFWRYIDDVGSILPNTWSKQRVLDVLNNFHPSIRVKASDLQLGDSMVWLDLQLYQSRTRRILIETHRKRLNSYDYLPANSMHHESVFPHQLSVGR